MDDNKRNIHYFEADSMRSLFKVMDAWQESNRKRLLSINIQKDQDMFCCIAATNPTEVIIVDPINNGAAAGVNGSLLKVSVY